MNEQEFNKLFKKFLRENQFFIEDKTFTYVPIFTLGMEVYSTLMEATENRIRIKTYKPRYKWSKALAYTDGVDVYLNQYKILRSKPSLYGSIAHELCHIAGFKHGSNCIAWYCNGRRKLKSVPYTIGREFKRWLEEEKQLELL
jgi:hypothetical protein